MPQTFVQCDANQHLEVNSVSTNLKFQGHLLGRFCLLGPSLNSNLCRPCHCQHVGYHSLHTHPLVGFTTIVNTWNQGKHGPATAPSQIFQPWGIPGFGRFPPSLRCGEIYISILKKKKGSHNREHTTTGQRKWRSELGKEKGPIWVVPAA